MASPLIIEVKPSTSHGGLPAAFARRAICVTSLSDKLRPTVPNRRICVSWTCSAAMPMKVTAQNVLTRAASWAGFRTLARIRSTPSVDCIVVIIGALHAACSRAFPANSILIESFSYIRTNPVGDATPAVLESV